MTDAMTRPMVERDIDIKELTKLLEDAAPALLDDPPYPMAIVNARNGLANLAPALAERVVADAALLRDLPKMLEDIRGFAQEVQRGTDAIKQGDAYGCGANIEEAANLALAKLRATS